VNEDPEFDMAEGKETRLGNGWHTLFSDEEWFLIIAPSSDEITLEARFETEAADRTGFPNWARTEFCTSKGNTEAACRVQFADAAELLAASRLSFIPENIWGKATEICRTLIEEPPAPSPDVPPDAG
jgi:hypothetical protein